MGIELNRSSSPNELFDIICSARKPSRVIGIIVEIRSDVTREKRLRKKKNPINYRYPRQIKSW